MPYQRSFCTCCKGLDAIGMESLGHGRDVRVSEGHWQEHLGIQDELMGWMGTQLYYFIFSVGGLVEGPKELSVVVIL